MLKLDTLLEVNISPLPIGYPPFIDYKPDFNTFLFLKKNLKNNFFYVAMYTYSVNEHFFFMNMFKGETRIGVICHKHILFRI